ncbi:FAD-binding protein [Halegenticoccus tardaugens]|uniref:FAD-binding protein n=1 Tax=Halegenticoccus tardaugens TaxID=2071624 RepID=UPI00100BAFB3|nr:FAD-binding protein [Halegenticoccus tardaugens]
MGEHIKATHDVVVVGAGGAGIRAAIAAHEEGADAAIVTKLHPVRSHTGSAEGGINAALHEGGTWESHASDTMKGADYLGDAPGVEALCREIPREVIQLEHWGLAFARANDGTVAMRPLAGHSAPRTTYAGAETGHQLLHALYQQLLKRGIQVYDEWYVTRLAVSGEERPEDRTCHGIVAIDIQTGEVACFRARRGVILATGGPGQAYDHTTNAVSCTGDGQAMAYRAGVPLEDMEFVQFHPTTLPSTGVLISEGVRGEGGILYNVEGERFMFEHGYANNDGELASRDVVSRAELTEVNEGRGIEDEYVHLDMRHLGEKRIIDRLENILHLAEDFEGVDALEDPMPVVPGQHFAMGGIETNENGETCISGLYAAGECACVSVHGANRLGGNALPELIVFGKRAGQHAAGTDLGEANIRTGRTTAATTRGDTSTATGGGDTDVAVKTIRRAWESERTRVERLLDGDGGERHETVRRELQTAVSDHLNVFRTDAEIAAVLDVLADCRDRYRDVSVSDPSRTFNTDLVCTLETRNLIDVAEAIALGARARTESRGAHWRVDYPERDDENWLKHTMLSWNDGEPDQWYRPVILEGRVGTYHPKVRQY